MYVYETVSRDFKFNRGIRVCLNGVISLRSLRIIQKCYKRVCVGKIYSSYFLSSSLVCSIM
jgi:hypothetical protein